MIFFLGLSVSALAGGDGGGATGAHGGNELAMEFQQIGYALADALDEGMASEFSTKISPKDFRRAVSQTKIVVVERTLKLHGHPVAAINYRSRLEIDLCAGSWRSLEAKTMRKAELVFHEYLGIMGVEWDHYRLSSALENAIAKHPEVMPELDRILLLHTALTCVPVPFGTTGGFEVRSKFITDDGQLSFSLSRNANPSAWDANTRRYDIPFTIATSADLRKSLTLTLIQDESIVFVYLGTTLGGEVRDRTSFMVGRRNDVPAAFRLFYAQDGLAFALNCESLKD